MTAGAEDLEAWLAEAYAPAYRTACLLLRDPVEAQDAVQEAFLRVWRFRTSVPAGEGRRPWLYRVVTNACLSRLRSERSWRAGRLPDGEALLASAPSAAPTPEAAAEAGGRAGDVLDALAALPETLRVPVVLRYWAGLSEREIAVAIERRPGTVKSRLYDARQRLALDPRLAAWVGDTDLEEAR